MVSVLLLTVALMTVGLLVIRSSNREFDQAGAMVARERALMSAQAAIDLAAARYRDALIGDPSALNAALAGYLPPGDQTKCTDPKKDCIPGQGTGVPLTGQRNKTLTANSDCAGRPCLRPGAIARLPDATLANVNWAAIPLRNIVPNADAEAIVTVWVRNNSSDALGGGTWTSELDGRVVITAMASLRNTTVAIEQEVVLAPGAGPQTWQMQSPDSGYGGGHNNDNSSVSVCKENYAGYQP